MTVYVVLAVAVLAFLALVLTIILVAAKPRPQPGLGPQQAVWNAELVGAGLFDLTYGTLAVRDGALLFTPDGAGAPAWSAPCRDLTARRGGALNRYAVELAGPRGTLHCNVSRERIDRASTNTIKTMRQRGYSAEFIGALVAAGARIL